MLEMKYEIAEDCSLDEVSFEGLTGSEYAVNVKDALNIMKIQRPDFGFVRDAGDGRYNEISDEAYNRLIENMKLISSLWCHSDDPETKQDIRQMNVLTLFANAVEKICAMHTEIRACRQESMKYIQKAAGLGDAEAQGLLAFRLEKGICLEKDEEQAVSWYRKAAEQDYAPAIICLAIMYSEGRGGLEQDYGRAMELFRKAADMGDACALYNIGVMFEKGRGVDSSDETALKYYKEAASRGHADARYALGVFYYNGRGTAADKAQAYEWFLKAAKQWHGKAQHCVAMMLREGDGVERNPEEAKVWDRKSVMPRKKFRG